MTLQKQTSQYTQGKLMFSQVDSLVNHTQVQENNLAKPMKDISFRICSAALKRSNPNGLLAKTFVDLLVGGGGVFNEVCDDLEREGYEIQSFLIPAASVNAPHQRQRIWFVAYSNDKGRSGKPSEVQKEDGEISEWYNDAEPSYASNWNASYSNSIGQECRKERECSKTRTQSNDKQFERCSKLYRGNFKMFPSESPLCGGDDGLPKELDNITFSKWRKESIKAYGNAIVPQVAFEIFKAINEFESLPS